MRVDLDTGKYNVVIDSSNLEVSIESGTKLDVNIGESARIDVNSAVTYIKSGKKEIDTYVDGKVKPDILEYSKVESQKFIDAYVGATVEEYVNDVTKPSIDEYADVKINAFNQNAVSKTDDYNTLAESLTNEYTSLAQTSEETLIQYVDSASLSAKNAKDSADVSTAQASESLASANASSNYAISSENSAKASAKSLSDAEGVLASTIAQKDIAVSSASSAKESETKAKTSETNAKASELSAKESASSALESANKSQQSAVTSGEYANSSKEDAENASASLTKVLQSEASAKSYSESAKESSDIAVAKADAAKKSETNAKASEDKATSEATKSENSAKQSQEYSENASQSAENALSSENKAKTSETNASQSATKSAQSEANALSYSQSAKSSSDSASNSVVECQAIKDSLGTVYKFKGSVASVSALPSGANIGDVYDVTESGNNYAWTGSSWDSLGINVDLSNYALKSDLNSKQDKLTAGSGIAIENGVISSLSSIELIGDYDSSNTYKAGDIVRRYVDDANGYMYFMSLSDNNTGNRPDVISFFDPKWFCVTRTYPYVYSSSSEVPIATINSSGSSGSTPSNWTLHVPNTTTRLNQMPKINLYTGKLKAPSGIEGYYTSSEVDEVLTAKQDTLVSGANIKTVNGESVLGSGDLEIVGGVSYEDLNEDVTINPAPIEAEWQAFRNEINSIISGYQSQVASLQSELNKVKSVRYVTQKYVNGTNWYTIYSDGWCEQGGRSALNEASTVTVTLHKAYKNTNYSVCAVSITESTAGDTECGLQCTPKTTSTITLTAHYLNPNNQNACWEAKGYIS